MKRKILIFALCFTLLLGVFSISAFAEDETITDLTSLSFGFEAPTIANGYGIFNVSGTIECNTVSFGHKIEEFYSLKIGYDTYGSKSRYICYDKYGSTNIMVNVSEPFTITFTGGDDVTNPSLISWVLENKLAHVHSYSSSVIQPTHVDKGYTLYTCECGDSYQDNFVAALGHNYTITEKVDPSCTTKGYTTYVCDCGDTYIEEGVAYGHTFTTTTLDPTCTKKGSITYVCDCGYSYFEDLPTLPHTYSSSVVDPTCSRKGYTMYTCECGYSYRDNYVDTIPHVFDGTHCSVCNALDPTYVIKSKDFSNVFVRLSEQIKVNTVVGVLGVAAAACVGLVFMWWGDFARPRCFDKYDSALHAPALTPIV